MSRLFGDEFITQKYLRQYPNSERARSWAGVMVHIQTENGVWRTGGSGYTYAGKPDAWVLPFEEAVKKIDHCGPEKCGKFLLAHTPEPELNVAVGFRHRLVGSSEWNFTSLENADQVRDWKYKLGDKFEVDALFAAPMHLIAEDSAPQNNATSRTVAPVEVYQIIKDVVIDKENVSAWSRRIADALSDAPVPQPKSKGGQ